VIKVSANINASTLCRIGIPVGYYARCFATALVVWFIVTPQYPVVSSIAICLALFSLPGCTEKKAEAVLAGKAALETSKAGVKAFEEAVHSAKVQLGVCTVRAPISGRKGSLLVNQGNIVQVNETVLITISQMRGEA
jgi:hypothetical protein